METIRGEIRHWIGVVESARTDAYAAFPDRLPDVERFALVVMEAKGGVTSLRGIAAAIDAQRVVQATKTPPVSAGMGAQ